MRAETLVLLELADHSVSVSILESNNLLYRFAMRIIRWFSAAADFYIWCFELVGRLQDWETEKAQEIAKYLEDNYSVPSWFADKTIMTGGVISAIIAAASYFLSGPISLTIIFGTIGYLLVRLGFNPQDW